MIFVSKVQILVTLSLLFPLVSWANCWLKASLRYNVDPWLLYAIAEQESSFNPVAVNENKNLSRDLGLMQINSFWLSELAEFGISESDLFDPCTNIHVGAWVLAQTIQIYGNNWKAVGAYNAGTKNSEGRENQRKDYASRVHRRYIKYLRMYD